MNQTDSYKVTDLDYLVGDHRLQMLKAALPFLSISQQRALSIAIKLQELRRTYSLFSSQETATMGICSLDSQPKTGSPKEMLNAIRPLRKSQRAGGHRYHPEADGGPKPYGTAHAPVKPGAAVPLRNHPAFDADPSGHGLIWDVSPL